jgi:alpha-beta hydrolase superfamily lysophospholipase
MARTRQILDWWQTHINAQIDHPAVVRCVSEEAGWTPRFVFMMAMSAAIAELGLLQSSPAVVIGAMLISPLMGPIIGLGFGVPLHGKAAALPPHFRARIVTQRG